MPCRLQTAVRSLPQIGGCVQSGGRPAVWHIMYACHPPYPAGGKPRKQVREQRNYLITLFPYVITSRAARQGELHQ